MPKDHSKQSYRGIGFVTFASPDSVERVMASKHVLHGAEVAIDRATPKGVEEQPGGLRGLLGAPAGAAGAFARPPPANQRRSFDNGARRLWARWRGMAWQADCCCCTRMSSIAWPIV